MIIAMRGSAYAAGFALAGAGLAACGSVVPRGPDDAAPADGKTGVIVDGSVGGTPPDAPPQMLCVAPSNPPTTKYHINLFATAEGHTGPDNSCPKVGFSYTSSNPQYVFCRRWGGEVKDSAGNYNHWWLWTELDDPQNAPAWISAYYIKDQGNDQANDITTGDPIPDCP